MSDSTRRRPSETGQADATRRLLCHDQLDLGGTTIYCQMARHHPGWHWCADDSPTQPNTFRVEWATITKARP